MATQLTYVDLSSPSDLIGLFKAQRTLSHHEQSVLKQLSFQKHRFGKHEFIDFSSASQTQVHDGNTLYNGEFVRRGLPRLSDDIVVPAKRRFELVAYTKTNGDCCMFSYLPRLEVFIIATRIKAVFLPLSPSAQGKDLINHIQRELSEHPTHLKFATLFFQFYVQLNQGQQNSLRSELATHTWVGDYLSGEILINYGDQPYLLMHSIVNTKSGEVQGDARQKFAQYGFQSVPSQSYGEMDSLTVIEKIKIIVAEIKCKSIAETNEGVVLQIIDHDSGLVSGLQNVKSIEYQIIKHVHAKLQFALEKRTLETHFDEHFKDAQQEFAELAGDYSDKLPCPIQFYHEVFKSGLSLLSAKRNPETQPQLKSLFINEPAAFITSSVTKCHQKGSLDLTNQLEFVYEAPTLVPSQASDEHQEQVQSKRSYAIASIAVVCPAFVLQTSTLENLKKEFQVLIYFKDQPFKYPKKAELFGKRLLILSQDLSVMAEVQDRPGMHICVYKVTDRSQREMIKNLWEQCDNYLYYSNESPSSQQLRREMRSYESELYRLEEEEKETEIVNSYFYSELELKQTLGRIVEGEDYGQGLKKEKRVKAATIEIEDDPEEEKTYRKAPSVKSLGMRGRTDSAEKVTYEQAAEEQPQKQRGRSKSQDISNKPRPQKESPPKVPSQREPRSKRVISPTKRADLSPRNGPNTLNAPNLSKQNLKHQKLVVLIPVGLPGFQEDLKHELVNSIPNLQLISEDAIREAQIKQYLQKKSDQTHCRALITTESQVTAKFNALTVQTIEKAQQGVFYLDKVHNPYLLGKVVELLEQKFNSVSIVSLVQQQSGKQYSLSQLLESYTCGYPSGLHQVTAQAEQTTFLKKIVSQYCQFDQPYENSALVCPYFNQQEEVLLVPKDLATLLTNVLRQFRASERDQDQLETALKSAADKIDQYRSMFGAQNPQDLRSQQRQRFDLTSVLGKSLKVKPVNNQQVQVTKTMPQTEQNEPRGRTLREQANKNDERVSEERSTLSKSQKRRQKSKQKQLLRDEQQIEPQAKKQTLQLNEQPSKLRKPRQATPGRAITDQNEGGRGSTQQSINRAEQLLKETQKMLAARQGRPQQRQNAQNQDRKVVQLQDKQSNLRQTRANTPGRTNDRQVSKSPPAKPAQKTKKQPPTPPPGSLQIGAANRFQAKQQSETAEQEEEEKIKSALRSSNKYSKQVAKRRAQRTISWNDEVVLYEIICNIPAVPKESSPSPDRVYGGHKSWYLTQEQDSPSRQEEETKPNDNEEALSEDLVNITEDTQQLQAQAFSRDRHLTEDFQIPISIASQHDDSICDDKQRQQLNGSLDDADHAELKNLHNQLSAADNQERTDVQKFKSVIYNTGEAEVAIQKVLSVLARPISLKSHTGKYLGSTDHAQNTYCDNDQLTSNDKFFMFPLDEGMVVLQHIETRTNLQMMPGEEDYRMRLDGERDQVEWERLLIQWSDQKQCFQLYSPHYGRLVCCEADGTTRGLDMTSQEGKSKENFDSWFIEQISEQDIFDLNIEQNIKEVEQNDFLACSTPRGEEIRTSLLEREPHIQALPSPSPSDSLAHGRDLTDEDDYKEDYSHHSSNRLDQSHQSLTIREQPITFFEEPSSQIPNLLLLNPRVNAGALMDDFAVQIPELLAQYVEKMLPEGELSHLQKLFEARQRHQDWSLSELVSITEYVDKKTSTWKKWSDKFEQGESKEITFVGFFIVPTWIIVAVGLPVDGIPQLPCVVIAQHESWQQEGQEGIISDTMELCNQAVQSEKRSPFRDMVRAPPTHKASGRAKWREAELDCDFDEEPVRAVFIQFDTAIKTEFFTQIIY